MTKQSNRRSPKAIALFLSIFFVTATLIASPSASADPIGDNECFPAVLMLRGSGESRTQVAERSYTSSDETLLVETNGYEGPVLRRALSQFVKQADPSTTISKLRFIGIDYPALAVDPAFEDAPDTTGLPGNTSEGIIEAWALRNAGIAISHLFSYAQSIDQGAMNVVDFIEAEKDTCDTQYILMGYSQGALAAREAIKIFDNPDKIIGTYLIGDPYQEGESADITKGQRTIASTGWDKDGLIRSAVDILSDFTSPPYWTTDLVKMAQFAAANNSLAKIDEAFGDADSTVYRHDSKMTSRSLCHEFDQICWTPLWESNVAPHESYFAAGAVGSAGMVDIAEETPAFDAQLVKLANSQNANPRERSLTQTVSVVGSDTNYKVANARSDDECRWDQGSDGSFDAPVSCADFYNVPQTGTSAKMTVEVKDSFNIIHTYSSEEPVIDPTVIEDLTGIPYDRWFRFESALDPKECVTMPQKFDFDFIDDGWYGTPLVSSPCLESPSQNYDLNASQVFKRSFTEAAGEKFDQYVWGYDDNYIVEGHLDGSSTALTDAYSYIGCRDCADPGWSGAKAEIAQIRNDEHYYQFKVFWGSRTGCFAHGLGNEEYDMLPCDPADERQLFKASLADPTEEYGALSIDRDVTPPSAVSNFVATEIGGSLFELTWDPSTDDRTDAISYYSIQSWDSQTWGGKWDDVATVSDDELLSLTESKHWTITKYRIRAEDYAGNRSEWVEVIL